MQSVLFYNNTHIYTTIFMTFIWFFFDYFSPRVKSCRFIYFNKFRNFPRIKNASAVRVKVGALRMYGTFLKHFHIIIIPCAPHDAKNIECQLNINAFFTKSMHNT